MNRKIAEAIINFANENNLDCMKDYSGRGMYGKKCIGIICDYKDILKVLGDIIVHLKDEELISSSEDLGPIKVDNMGLQEILYFELIGL